MGRNRKRVVYLAGVLFKNADHRDPHWYRWAGVRRACEERDYDLLTVIGGVEPLQNPERFYFNVLSKDSFDGMVAWVSSVTPNEQAYFSKYTGKPVVALSNPVPAFPVVRIDNKMGMLELLSHLMDDHGFTRVAFVQGPQHHLYARARLESWYDAYRRRGLEADLRLLSPPGTWFVESGVEAVKYFLDIQKLAIGTDLQAIACCNDRVAVAVIKELAVRGFRVPADVVVTGFNNLDDAMMMVPSVTSVATPLVDQSEEAVRLLGAWFEGATFPAVSELSTYLCIHESCGCSRAVPVVGAGGQEADIAGVVTRLKALHDTWLAQIRTELYTIEPLIDRAWAKRFFDAFLEMLLSGLVKPVSDLLMDAIYKHNSLHTVVMWQTILESLRSMSVSFASRGDDRLIIERLSSRIQDFLIDIDARRRGLRSLEVLRIEDILKTLDNELVGIENEADLIKVFARHLPLVGLPAFAFVLFDCSVHLDAATCYGAEFPETARQVLAWEAGGRASIKAKRFKTHEILPGGWTKPGRRRSLVLQGLRHGEDAFGYAVFEIGDVPLPGYEGIALRFANALQTCRLKESITLQALELARANRQLEEWMTTAEKAQEQLVQNERLVILGGMLAGITHEIGNPIGTATVDRQADR